MGSHIGIHMEALIRSAKKNVPDKNARRELYIDMIKSFGEEDWDPEDCLKNDPVYDAALKQT